MSSKARGVGRQLELIPRSKRPTIALASNHRLVELADLIDWMELEARAEKVRQKKLKSNAGQRPQMRVLLGAMVLRATRYMPYRVLEDQIRYYAPARYLCGLTETEWSPDHNTLHDFMELMGEEGSRLINEYVVEWAVEEKLADPKLLVADTTAQEAAVPYPNEIGLLSGFARSLAATSKKAGTGLKRFAQQAATKFKDIKEQARKYRLFAKKKSKQHKDRLTAKMVSVVEQIQKQLGKALAKTAAGKERLSKYRRVARAKVERLHTTMKKLTPQIRYWLKTGWVAPGKVVSMNIPELYSVVRGKVGKKVEFGLSWGIRRLKGGFVLATMAKDRKELVDARFVVRAVDEHIALFGKAPRAYAYDRGGWANENIAAIECRGVEQVAVAPRGKTAWKVSGKVKEELVRERAQVEGAIGTIKHNKYGFNKPAARSARMMATCGQLAVLGFNLNKLVRQLAERRSVALVG